MDRSPASSETGSKQMEQETGAQNFAAGEAMGSDAWEGRVRNGDGKKDQT
jgi:hypothetical protein